MSCLDQLNAWWTFFPGLPAQYSFIQAQRCAQHCRESINTTRKLQWSLCASYDMYSCLQVKEYWWCHKRKGPSQRADFCTVSYISILVCFVSVSDGEAGNILAESLVFTLHERQMFLSNVMISRRDLSLAIQGVSWFWTRFLGITFRKFVLSVSSNRSCLH